MMYPSSFAVLLCRQHQLSIANDKFEKLVELVKEYGYEKLSSITKEELTELILK